MVLVYQNFLQVVLQNRSMKKNSLFIGSAIGFIILSTSVTKKWLSEVIWPKKIYNYSNNPTDFNKIQIGRALFYDPLLSFDNTISCASCHSPYNAFAHTDHSLSHGINDSIGNRNTPALFNLAWQPIFMWDGAVNHLDVQSLAPISHPDEMGSSINDVVKKLNQSILYKKLFILAYNDSLATGERVLKSLSQFMLTLESKNSKYDQVKLGKQTFTTQEKNGYELFAKHCSSCHTEPLFTNHSFQNNRLPIDASLNDYGRYTITKNPIDSLKFKVPSLRNLEYTYPYMHDGRFNSLSEVLNHYSNEMIPLNSNERVDIIAFLLTLSDKEFVFNPNNTFPRELFFPSAKDSK